MKPIFGNAFAVREPDRRAREAVRRALAKWWPQATIVQPASDWLLASADVGPAGVIGRATGDEWTIAFAEDSTGALDAAPFHGLIPTVAAGDVTAIGVKADGSVRAVRSAAGTVPLYVAKGGERVGVSTLAEPLVRFVLGQPAFDPLGLAPWMLGSGGFPDARTWYRDLDAVPAGVIVDVGRRGIMHHYRYFNPRPERLAPPTQASRASHAQRMRAAVLGTLQRTLDPDGGNLLTLSGGADSSALGFLASGTLGVPIMTLSLLSPTPAERERDLASIRSFVAAHPPKRQWFAGLSTQDRLEAMAKADPACVPLLHPALHHLPSLCEQEDIVVLFGGEFADEVCGARPQMRDWIEQTSFGELAAAAVGRRLPNGPRDVARWFKWRRLRGRPGAWPRDGSTLPDYLSPGVAYEYKRWLEWFWGVVREDPRPWRHLASRLAMLIDASVAMNWEAASRRGVLRVYPFLSRETLEIACQAHPSELLGPGYKRLLIQAFREDVPAWHLELDKRSGFPRSMTSEGVDMERVMLGVLARLSGATTTPSATLVRTKQDETGRRPVRRRAVRASRK